VDFFGAQARARQQSRLLGWGFALSVLAVVVALDAIVLMGLRIKNATGGDAEPFEGSLLEWALVHPGTLLLVSLVVGSFIGVASLTRILQLREGGGYVARSLGGVRVERGTPDPRRRQLHNVVEEMALASGVPVPEVYVLENDDSINAFAAGHTPANAAVAVTRGALVNLNREQLQGVIAHEFSHILNGDMRLSIRLMGMVFGLMAVATAGRLLLRLAGSSGGSRRDRGVLPLAALGMAIAVVGQIGFWAGRVLQAWISRKRECLADASAVQFTRNPEGLRDALVRIAAHGGAADPAGTGKEEIAHLLFAPGGRRLMATHPPLIERVQELDPQVTPARFESMIRQAREQMRRLASVDPAPTPVTGNAGAVNLAALTVPVASALIADSAGDPAPRHLEQAVAVRRALPSALHASAERPEHAQALLLSIVICANASAREQQLACVREKLGDAMAEEVQQVAAATANLEPMLRLPAVLQLIPALRALPATERLRYVVVLKEVVRLDGTISAFEYALEKLAIRALVPREAARDPHGNLAIDGVVPSLGIVFAVLARQGARNDAQARQAYESGIGMLLPMHRPAYSIIDEWVGPFDQALEQLCRLRVAAKQLLIEALVRTIAHDEMLAPAEAELLRAICAVLECPLPPLLPAAVPQGMIARPRK
jgi:Zn-dependent protease with chaperone function